MSDLVIVDPVKRKRILECQQSTILSPYWKVGKIFHERRPEIENWFKANNDLGYLGLFEMFSPKSAYYLIGQGDFTDMLQEILSSGDIKDGSADEIFERLMEFCRNNDHKASTIVSKTKDYKGCC